MADISKINGVINKINSYSKEIDELEKTIRDEYFKEKKSVDNQVKSLIDEMNKKLTEYLEKQFGSIKKDIVSLINYLKKDYPKEWEKTSKGGSRNAVLPYEQKEKALYAAIDEINKGIRELNELDFNSLCPPTKSVAVGEKVEVYVLDKLWRTVYAGDEMIVFTENKYAGKIVSRIFVSCNEALDWLELLESHYKGRFNIGGYEAFVNAGANAWISETKGALRARYSNRFEELFIKNTEEGFTNDFYQKLEEEGRRYEVDWQTGSFEYSQKITLGDANILVDNVPKHLDYFEASPVLSKYLKSGYLKTPAVLDLQETGSILINVNEENTSSNTKNLVNQLITQFLLSFPVNRIDFCLIDIENKMGFSHFSTLTKINNEILNKGIIRDDRKLEDIVKDLEQMMYKVEDECLSYNGVSDIYEYNRKFPSNPQSFHLLVLTNYPNAIREDVAKRILKIVQNGMRVGIFTVIINNEACALSSGYKEVDHQAFLQGVAKHSLVINGSKTGFSLEMAAKNKFTLCPVDYVSHLPEIIKTLQENVESNRQTTIPLTDMFDVMDSIVANSKRLPTAGEVIDIPLGLRGGELQSLALSTRGNNGVHTVVIGGTGSGKSNLLHTIILNSCYRYSPDELNLYLVDFKGGVGFTFYEANGKIEKQLPHIKLIGLTEDPEDGVAILKNIHRIMSEREQILSNNSVADIVEYTKLGNKMPRLLVIIDEIQELLQKDDKICQKAMGYLRELFKKGRSFGINMLWASQNIPNVPGLKDNVLSQTGYRISLRLNNPDDALVLGIDPKDVRNLNRPEKGLALIKDSISKDSTEFRIAFAEDSVENRTKFTDIINNKWSKASNQEPMYIVGKSGEASPMVGNTIYNGVLSGEPTSEPVLKYKLQLGQDFITGKPFNVDFELLGNNENILITGYDMGILRDMMGYSLLSLAINNLRNTKTLKDKTKIYYANGEILNPANSNDLFNVMRRDFKDMLDDISSNSRMLECFKEIYKLYEDRSANATSMEVKTYSPCFVVIHSLQRYLDLFNENPSLTQDDNSRGLPGDSLRSTTDYFVNSSRNSSRSGSSKNVTLMDAFSKLFVSGGQFGIHFIISTDDPLSVSAIKNNIEKTAYKIFTKGVSANIVTSVLGDYKAVNNLNKSELALLCNLDERYKIKYYAYNPVKDCDWYKKIYEVYLKLWSK